MTRNTLKTIGFSALLALLAALFSGALVAEEKLKPEEILKRMDINVSGYDDQYMEVTMRIHDAAGKSKDYDIRMWQKGEKKRMIRFVSGEVKGMSMLILDRDNAFIYLPGYKKVRRVATHGMSQTFAGSTFTNDDMAATTWADIWDAKLIREDETMYVLECTPKAGKNVEYAKAIVYVGKEQFSQEKVEYYNAKGELIKLYENAEPKQWTPTMRRHSLVTMTDVRTGHKTELIVKKMEVNKGLEDSIFTTRNLQWGR